MNYISKFIEYIDSVKRYSPLTVKSYVSDLNQFEKFLSLNLDLTLKDVKTANIKAWISHLVSKGYDKNSVNRKLSVLRRYYRFQNNNNFFNDNPTKNIISLKTKKKIPEFASKEDLNILFDNNFFLEGYIGERDKTILQMFYYTGIRLSELINLKVNDISFYQKYIKVTGKRDKQRLIPLLDSHLTDLKKFISVRDNCFKNNSKYLFLNHNGKKLYPKLVYRIVKSYISKVSTITKKSPHTLRHAFATHLLNEGADLMAIKEILGHSSLNSTQIYTHTSYENLKKIYNLSHPRGSE